MNSNASNTPNQPVFSEKLVPSLWGFVAVALLWPSVWLVFLPINAVVGFWLAPSLTAAVWAGMFFGSPTIVVQGGQLWVGSAHIPVKYVSVATGISGDDVFEQRGVKLDARAFVRFQMGVKTLVKIEINDANDPTPYWLVSTRKPQELVLALSS